MAIDDLFYDVDDCKPVQQRTKSSGVNSLLMGAICLNPCSNTHLEYAQSADVVI